MSAAETTNDPGGPSTPDDKGDGLESARRVLRMEGDALFRLAAVLDRSFLSALDHLEQLTGRVVVTGMGKSGHIARKIAATMASTGTPALFVHPGEASHGDLGMIARNDAVIALSNSGDTDELSDIIAFTRRFGIPLIGITRRRNSTLGEQADVVLLLPDAGEACPLGLAPTTSSTMMLALGDALAVALFERRGFTASDFSALHPGGQLGRALLRVTDLMHKNGEVPLVSRDAVMAGAILEMTAKHFGCVGVVDQQGRLEGIITDGDLRRHMNPQLLAVAVTEIMTPNPKTIRAGALAAEALGVMNTRAITSLFVTEAGRPVGILHIHDCLRAGLV